MSDAPLGPSYPTEPGYTPPPPGPEYPPPGPGYPPPGPGYPPPGQDYPPPGYGYPPQYGYGYPPPSPQYASFWARLGAYLIDSLIVGAFLIPAVIALVAGPTELDTCSVNEEGDIVFGEPDNAICEQPTSGTIAITIALGIAGYVAGAVYFVKLEGSKGQTVGKQAVGIAVVDVNTGQPIGIGRGVGRYFGRWLSGIPCYLGFLWTLWDPQKQTWHDKLTSSVVVKR